MNEITPVGAVRLEEAMSSAAAVRDSSFASLVLSGIGQVEASTAASTEMLASYAVGGDVSPHELMIAMEKAKMSLQLMVEMRNRMVEAYQEVVRLQI